LDIKSGTYLQPLKELDKVKELLKQNTKEEI